MMEITMKELEQMKEDNMDEADKIITEKIIKLAKQGYTSAGIVWMLCNFNLITGKGRDEKIDNPFEGEIIQVTGGN
tara:strand:- start:3798 stop:4025 length:228 start_codon:yes stop_codon:yes gene_type:complete